MGCEIFLNKIYFPLFTISYKWYIMTVMRGKTIIARKLAVVALLTALSLITFLLENLLPPIFIPGAKLGLANAFSFAALVLYGPAEAFAVVIVRTLLGAIFAGNISALMYSFTGGVTAMAISSLLFYLIYPRISLIAVSAAGAAAHNLTQSAVFALISSTPLAFSYAPYLMLIGVFSGAAVGALINIIFKRVPISVFAKVSAASDKAQEDGRGGD